VKDRTSGVGPARAGGAGGHTLGGIQIGGKRGGRFKIFAREDIELAGEQGDRTAAEDQSGIVVGFKTRRRRRQSDADLAGHGPAILASEDVMVADPVENDPRRADPPLGRPPRLAGFALQARPEEDPDLRIPGEAVFGGEAGAVAGHRNLGERGGLRRQTPRRPRSVLRAS
jgi:hypothetical protein